MKLPRTILFLLLFLASVVSAVSLRHFSFSGARTANTQTEKLIVESKATLRAEGRGGSTLKLRDGRTIPTEYTGTAELLSALQTKSVRPLALAAGDFDGDGVDDLISGYATDNGGLITLHHGNIDSIFPNNRNADEISPFFADAKVFAVSDKPEFIGVGDFNNDGKQDVVTAERGGDTLSFFKGDGKGNLLQAETISLQGRVTALVAGDLNRKDNLKDLAIGLTGENGSRVVIFEGNSSLQDCRFYETETIDLPDAATAFAIVSFGELSLGDLAVATGRELFFIHGRNRQLNSSKENRRVSETVISRKSFDSKIIALSAGRFTDGAADEIILLDENGVMFRVASDASHVKNIADEALRVAPLGVQNIKGKTVALNSARVSASGAGDDLILLDSENRKMQIFRKGEHLELQATFDGEDEIIAAQPMRLNKDGLDDIVFLSKNRNAPSVAMTVPAAVFVVNSTGDEFDRDINDNICEIAPQGSGICTWRAVVQQANATAGADEIRFNLPGAAPFTITPGLGTGQFTGTVTIDATTQPGFSGSPVVELNCSTSQSGIVLGTSNSVARGFVINRNNSAAISLSGSNNRIEGNFVGTDATGTRGFLNGRGGISVAGSNHTIGGSTAAARNVISGTSGSIGVGNTTGLEISGNFIGTDKTGTAGLLEFGSTQNGILISPGSATLVGIEIGGDTPNERNIISRHGINGIHIVGINLAVNSAIVIANNFIGTDVTGSTDLGNTGRGIYVQHSTNAAILIGGSQTSFNLISGNDREGIRLERSSDVVIQSNLIGTRLNGLNQLLNSRHPIFLADMTGNTTIGGGGTTTGECDAGCNLLAFGGGFDGVGIVNNNPTLVTPETADGNSNAIEPTSFILGNLGVNDLPIDLGTTGRTPNDPGDTDTGPNRLQNFAEITQAAQQGINLNVQGTLNSTPDTGFTIDFYLVQDGTPVEGTRVTFVHTATVITDTSGNATFNQTFAASTQMGDRVFAVTTNNVTRDSSESSPLVTIQVSSCSFIVNPLTFNDVPATGQTLTVNVTTQPGCNWTAASNSAFITGGGSGSGNGSTTFTVAGNISNARTGTMTVAGQTVTVNQASGCTFTVNPTNFDVQPAGGQITVNVQTSALAGNGQCEWTAVSNSSFITGSGGGMGNGSVTFTVQQNVETGPRQGTVNVAGQVVNVNQANCTFIVSPLTFSIPAAGGSRTVNIETQTGCGWTASENETFINNLNPTNGTGNGSVTFDVAANTGATRQGTVTVAGQTVTVEQLAQSCSFIVEPLLFNVSAAQQNITVNVTTQAGCSWTAASNTSFVTGSGGGTGSGAATFTVFQNVSIERGGTLTVAGQTVTVNQANGCQFIVSHQSFNVSPVGGTIQVFVNTSFFCTWSGASNDAFITGGGNFIGPGSITFTVAANAGAMRQGTVTVAGQNVTINQGTGQSCSFVVNPLTFNNVPQTGASLTVNVTTQPGCFWDGASNAHFIFGGGNGIGNGSATFTVLSNNSLPRIGTLTVAGQTVAVNQLSICNYTVTPNLLNFGAQGGTSPVELQTDSFCLWETSGNAPAFIIPAQGNGSRLVTVGISGNTGPDPRSRTVTVADQTITVNQAGCSYALSPATLTFPASASARAFQIDTDSSCQWSASLSHGSMGSITPTSGTGDDTVIVVLNTNNGNTRMGNVAVTGGGTVAIRQLGKNNNLDFDNDNRADIAKVGTGSSIADFGFGIADLKIGAEIFEDALNPNVVVNWVINNSSDGTQRIAVFGENTDKIVPGDYNGDGRADLAVFRPSDRTWYIARPTGIPAQNFDAIQFGLSTDRPVPADYDGDGRTDIAVFRPSDGTWWILRSTDGSIATMQWGLNGDKPVPGDYDGDGLIDIAVWRPSDGVWYIVNSGNGSFSFVQWGLSSDKPAMGDYDGDFKTDIAVFRPSDGTWFILLSSDNSLRAVNWGIGSDTLVPADYDGDLKTDIAVWRPSEGNWYILQSSNGNVQIKQLGQNGDLPVPSALLPE